MFYSYDYIILYGRFMKLWCVYCSAVLSSMTYDHFKVVFKIFGWNRVTPKYIFKTSGFEDWNKNDSLTQINTKTNGGHSWTKLLL